MTMFNFSQETVHESSNVLIPAGTLAFAMVKVRGLKNSQSTRGEYADLELVLMGEFENRRVFTLVANPIDDRNGNKWREMATAAIQHSMEAAGVFRLGDEASYKQFVNSTFMQIMAALDGKRVAIKVKVEKGKDGYQDKNAVAEWLSPNPLCSAHKAWLQLNDAGAVSKNNALQFASAATLIAQSAAASVAPLNPAGIVAGDAPAWL